MITSIGGFLMALADSVPGVSGGTIAFIMGFYDEFIEAISKIFKGSKEEKLKAIKFLIKLGIGWAIGMVSAVLVLTSIFEKHIYQISSLFFGFILASFPIIIKEEIKSIRGKYINLLFTALGCAIVIGITMLSSQLTGGNEGGFTFTFTSAIVLFFGGAIAICAMVLPGISGSTVLLIFGLYIPVITAVKDIITLDFKALPICIVFGLGVLFGIACFIGALKKALKKYRSQTIYLVLGLMLGSFYAIIQGPTSLDTPKPAMTLGSFSLLFALIGVAIVNGIQGLKILTDKKESSKNAKLAESAENKAD